MFARHPRAMSPQLTLPQVGSTSLIHVEDISDNGKPGKSIIGIDNSRPRHAYSAGPHCPTPLVDDWASLQLSDQIREEVTTNAAEIVRLKRQIEKNNVANERDAARISQIENDEIELLVLGPTFCECNVIGLFRKISDLVKYLSRTHGFPVRDFFMVEMNDPRMYPVSFDDSLADVSLTNTSQRSRYTLITFLAWRPFRQLPRRISRRRPRGQFSYSQPGCNLEQICCDEERRIF